MDENIVKIKNQRANKSVRAFEHVVDSLSKGRQPEKEILSKEGAQNKPTNIQRGRGGDQRSYVCVEPTKDKEMDHVKRRVH